MIPLIGAAIAERLRNKGVDSCISSDDPSKHSKSHRQIASIPAKIPSRDAFPADIPNVHPSSSERRGKSKYSYSGGPISASPSTETINSDTTEYTATNATPTTDGQSHTNKKPPLDSCRPATDSAPPASRIGSTAQCKGMKVYAVGIKNLPTHYRSLELSAEQSEASEAPMAERSEAWLPSPLRPTNLSEAGTKPFQRSFMERSEVKAVRSEVVFPTAANDYQLLFLNVMFYQDHLPTPPVETPLVFLLVFRYLREAELLIANHRSVPFRSALLYRPSIDRIYPYHIIFIPKTDYPVCLN
jgi:hypothetical protein